MQTRRNSKSDVPRGTLRYRGKLYCGPAAAYFTVFASGVVTGMVMGLAWATIVEAHAYEQAVEAVPRPCLRTVEIRDGVRRDFGCHNGNWRYGHSRRPWPGPDPK